MKDRVVALDRLLNEIIQSSHFSRFTITKLRVEYMRHVPPLFAPSQQELRRYIYKQVGRLVRLGWLVREGKPMSRDVQHLVRELPEGVTLRLTEPPFGQEIPFMPDMDADGKSRSTSTVPETNSLTDIEAKLKQVRMEFIATLGEAETYKALLTDHPGLRNQLEPLYHLSRDQSSNLMGQLRALEQTLKLLEEQ